jgi:D-glycero-D-manno-heptose 1,7-bisphosphate phosphatase
MAEHPNSGLRPGVRRALFVDRDGTLNPDLHYLKDANRIELFRGVGDALSLAHEHGFLTICVTNQSGVERGLYTDGDVERIHARLNQLLRPHRARIDGFYYCPHVPEHRCACRKPGTLLFEQARDEWRLDLGSSAIIGDRGLDVEAGRRLGMLTAIVPRPGLEAAAEAELIERGVHADLTASTFANAALRILSRG